MKRSILILCLAAMAGACSESTSITTTTGGSFTLTTVNGGDLPAVVSQEGTTRRDALSGSIVLASDMTWTSTITFRDTNGSTTGQNVTETDSGTWTQSNGAILLTSHTGTAFNAVLFGGALTIEDEGAIYLYRQ
jgi:hypothetical protein